MGLPTLQRELDEFGFHSVHGMPPQGIIRRYQEQGAGASTSSSVAAFQALPYGIQMRLTPYYARCEPPHSLHPLCVHISMPDPSHSLQRRHWAERHRGQGLLTSA